MKDGGADMRSRGCQRGASEGMLRGLRRCNSANVGRRSVMMGVSRLYEVQDK